MSRPAIRTGGSGVVLVLVGILLSLLGDASVRLFAIGLAVVGAGTVVLTVLFFSALGHIEDRDTLPDPDAWNGFSAPGSGTWISHAGDADAEPAAKEGEVPAGMSREQTEG